MADAGRRHPKRCGGPGRRAHCLLAVSASPLRTRPLRQIVCARPAQIPEDPRGPPKAHVSRAPNHQG
eukprot:2030886-Pyramimonas_sp.AAC.1